MYTLILILILKNQKPVITEIDKFQTYALCLNAGDEIVENNKKLDIKANYTCVLKTH